MHLTGYFEPAPSISTWAYLGFFSPMRLQFGGPQTWRVLRVPRNGLLWAFSIGGPESLHWRVMTLTQFEWETKNRVAVWFETNQHRERNHIGRRPWWDTAAAPPCPSVGCGNWGWPPCPCKVGGTLEGVASLCVCVFWSACFSGGATRDRLFLLGN